MKKLSPRGVHFLVFQGVLFVAVVLLPGIYLRTREFENGFAGAGALVMAYSVAGLALVADALWTVGVLARYHERHPEISPWRALSLWAVYLVLAFVGGILLNSLIAAGGVSRLDWESWLPLSLTGLIPAVVLWAFAANASTRNR